MGLRAAQLAQAARGAVVVLQLLGPLWSSLRRLLLYPAVAISNALAGLTGGCAVRVAAQLAGSCLQSLGLIRCQEAPARAAYAPRCVIVPRLVQVRLQGVKDTSPLSSLPMLAVRRAMVSTGRAFLHACVTHLQVQCNMMRTRRVLISLFSASALARCCRRRRMQWYCLAFTYTGSSSVISVGSASRACVIAYGIAAAAAAAAGSPATPCELSRITLSAVHGIQAAGKNG